MQSLKHQRGAIASMWLYVAGALILIGALTGLIVAWNNYTAGLDKRGYDRGVAETTASYVARDNQQLQAALAAQRTAEVNARNAEARAAASENLSRANYQKGLTDGQAKTAALVAAADAGTLQLRDPGQVAGTCTAGRGGVGEGPANSAGPGNDGTGAGGLPKAPSGLLSTDASAFLVTLAGQADVAALKIARLQARVLSDLALCNGP